MHFCRRGIIRKYDLIAFLNFSMLLVAVKVSSRFFVQRASTSLWHFLWGLSFHNLSPAPCFICSFSSRVLRWRGAITNWHQWCDPHWIADPYFPWNYEIPKKLVINACICQEFAILPHRLLVRNIVNTFNTKKLAETRTVNYLILYLMVTQTIITLKKQDLEHQHTVYRRTTGITFALSGKRADSRVGRKISNQHTETTLQEDCPFHSNAIHDSLTQIVDYNEAYGIGITCSL